MFKLFRILPGRPRPFLSTWHLVPVGTRDPSKQLLGIIAFDSRTLATVELCFWPSDKILCFSLVS